MNLIKLERGSVGNNSCPICNEKHVPQNKCRFEALSSKISKLMQANQIIPSLLQANKEAVTTATQFQLLLKQADYANSVLMEILATYGEVGEEIKNKYLERVDAWAKETISQNTEEQKPDTEKSTLSETSDKISTVETMSGESSLILS